jgi:SAM-dependent methyltransferase
MLWVNWHAVELTLRYALIVGLSVYMMNQVRKPTKWVGRLFAWIMNISHSKLTDLGLQHLPVEESFTILDVGCGGGRTIQKLAAMAAKGMVYGIDYAKGSVAAASSKNADLIKAGRVAIKQASVSLLPFADDKFDLVTAVETQYYWPDLVSNMQEIRRVLKVRGTLIVIAESYKKGLQNKLERPLMKLLRTTNLSPDDHRRTFAEAGFTEIQIFEESAKGWICVIAKKPV